MIINTINGIHKRIILFQIIFSFLVLPISVYSCIVDFSLKCLVILISAIITIIVFTLIWEIAVYHDEPHTMFIDLNERKAILVYKKKNIIIENIHFIHGDDKIWFISMLDYFPHNIEIEFEENSVEKKICIGYAPKKEIDKINNIKW